MDTKEKGKSKRVVVASIAVLLVLAIIIAIILANKGKVYFEDVPTYHVGEIVEYEGLQITLLGYDEFTENSWTTADEGKVFLFPIVEVVNNTDERRMMYAAQFDCYYKNREIEETKNASSAYAGYDGVYSLGDYVEAGETITGCIPLEVPEMWETIELYYFDTLDIIPSFGLIVEK